MRYAYIAVVALLAVGLAPVEASAEDAVLTGQVRTKEPSEPLPGVTVALVGLGATAVTDVEGRYVLRVPAQLADGRTATVRATLMGFESLSQTVELKAGTQTRDFDLGLLFFEEIVVGSRAGSAADKAVPVDTITHEDIESVPAAETAQIIQAVTPSFNFPRPTITDGTDTVRPATLRGLGPDQVLVTLNGKRRHTSALVHVNGSVGRGSTGVDLNAIPSSAIEDVQILRDGAAAQYGSDAIAGVLNLDLRSGTQPFTITLKGLAARTDQGFDDTVTDGKSIDAGLSYGFGVGRGSVFMAGEFLDRGATNRARPDPRDQIQKGDGGNNAVPQPNHHWGDGEEQDVLTFLNAAWPLDEQGATFLYAFGGWSRRSGSHGGFFRRSLDDRNWPQIYPLGFLPLIEPNVTDTSSTVGVRSAKSEWFWDVSFQYGHNSFDFKITDSLNASLGPSIPPNQTEFDSGALKFGQFITNADVSRRVNLGLAGPLNLAFGAEFRRESYQVVAGEPASYMDGHQLNQFGKTAAPGAQVFPGFKPENEVDANRNNVALYLDLEADVIKRVRLGVAGRFENYDDFGSTWDGKATLRLQPHDKVVLRAAASTGFRAPSLAQSWFTATSTNFLPDPVTGQQVPFDVGTFAVESTVAKALGAQPLKPEQSVHYSGGLVLTPWESVEISADYYRIAIDDRIVLSGNFTAASLQPVLRPFGVSGARFFTNAIDTRTQGLDVSARWKANVGSGRLTLAAAYNTGLGMNTEKNDADRHYGTKIVGSVDTPPQLAGFEQVLFDKVERRRTQCGQPKDNLRLTAMWRQKGWSGVLRNNRYGEFCSADRAVVDQIYEPKWVTDIELVYSAKHLTLGIGSQNLFDVYPDQNLPQNSFNGIFPYTAISPFGFNGRVLYARLSVKL